MISKNGPQRSRLELGHCVKFMIITIIKSIKLQINAKEEITEKSFKLCSFNETQVNVLFSYSAAFRGNAAYSLWPVRGGSTLTPFRIAGYIA